LQYFEDVALKTISSPQGGKTFSVQFARFNTRLLLPPLSQIAEKEGRLKCNKKKRERKIPANIFTTRQYLD
jgi:hypothetical protein